MPSALSAKSLPSPRRGEPAEMAGSQQTADPRNSEPAYPTGGIKGGRHALEIGSHHQPLSHASGCGPTPKGRHMLAVGSHHWPASHASGCGPTPRGRHMLAVGSHHWPASHGRAAGASAGRHRFAFVSHHSPSAHCAELTAGETVVPIAIGANIIAATETRRQTSIRMAHPLSVVTVVQVQLRHGGLRVRSVGIMPSTNAIMPPEPAVRPRGWR